MHVETQAPLARSLPKSRRLLRLTALILVPLAVAIAAWLLIRGGDENKRAPAAGVSVERLTAFAGTVPHPVYWAGQQSGAHYELTQTQDGRIYVRYLPAGTKVGDSSPKFLTVGTYPLKDAFATLQATAKKQGVQTIKLSRGGLAFQDQSRPTSVYLAYPGSDFEVEVFHRSPVKALKLASSGNIRAIEIPGAEQASAEQLHALPAALGHPVYWAGEASNVKYEMTATKGGRVFIRYLPVGAEIGDRNASYLSVGTYPQKDAYEVLQARAAADHVKVFTVRGGGLAYVDRDQPNSVYAAYPGSDLQIEVYDPDAAKARQLIASGQISKVR